MRQNISFGLIAAIVSLVHLACGCAAIPVSSHMTSVKLVQAAGPYRALAIAFMSNDITVNALVEREFADLLGREGINCIPVSTVFISEQVKDGTQLLKALTSRGAEAVMLIELAQTGEEMVYVPPKEFSTTYGSGRLYGVSDLLGRMYFSGQAQQSGFSFYRGGHYVSMPWARCEFILAELVSNRIVWTGFSVTKGLAHSKIEDFIRAGVAEAVRKLKEDGVVLTVRK